MFKIKLMMGVAALATTMVVLTAPAMAEFESTNGQTRGPIKTFPEVTTFESIEGGQKIECKKSLGEPKGEWDIQKKQQIQQGKYFYQEQTLKGPHEQLKIEKWGHCATASLVEGKVKCNLQVEIGGQSGNPLSASNGTGSVYPSTDQSGTGGCKVFFGGEHFCEVQVEANGNKELNRVTLANAAGGGVEVGSEVSGITSTLQESIETKGEGKCKELGVKGGQGTGKFKTKNNLITEGQKLA